MILSINTIKSIPEVGYVAQTDQCKGTWQTLKIINAKTTFQVLFQISISEVHHFGKLKVYRNLIALLLNLCYMT